MADSVDSISTTSRKNESPRITSDTVPTSPHVVTFVKTSPRDNPTVDATTGVHKTPSSEATVSEQPGIDTVPETSVEMESFQAAGSPDSLPIERHVEPSPPTKESAVPLPDHSPEIRRRSQSPRNSQNNGKGHHKSSKKDKEFSFRISPLNNEIHSSSYSPTSSERRLSVESDSSALSKSAPEKQPHRLRKGSDSTSDSSMSSQDKDTGRSPRKVLLQNSRYSLPQDSIKRSRTSSIPQLPLRSMKEEGIKKGRSRSHSNSESEDIDSKGFTTFFSPRKRAKDPISEQKLLQRADTARGIEQTLQMKREKFMSTQLQAPGMTQLSFGVANNVNIKTQMLKLTKLHVDYMKQKEKKTQELHKDIEKLRKQYYKLHSIKEKASEKYATEVRKQFLDKLHQSDMCYEPNFKNLSEDFKRGLDSDDNRREKDILTKAYDIKTKQLTAKKELSLIQQIMLHQYQKKKLIEVHQIELTLMKEVQKLEYNKLIYNVEERLSEYQTSYVSDTWKHPSRKKELKGYKIEFKLQMLLYEKELLLKQQAVVRKLVQLHHDKQLKALLGHQQLDALELAYLFARTFIVTEEKYLHDCNLLSVCDTNDRSPRDDNDADIESPPSSFTSNQSSSKGKLYLNLGKLLSECHDNPSNQNEDNDPKTPSRLSPRYRSKESTPRSSPRRVSDSPSPRITRENSRKSSPRYIPGPRNSPPGIYAEPRRVSIGSQGSDRDNILQPRRSSADRIVGRSVIGDSSQVCDSSESPPIINPRFSLTRFRLESMSTSSKSSSSSTEEDPEKPSPEDEKPIRTFFDSYNNLSELKQAYATEQEKIRTTFSDQIFRIKQKEATLQQEIAVPIVSLVFLKQTHK